MRWGLGGVTLTLLTLGIALMGPGASMALAAGHEMVLRRGNGAEPESLDPAKVESVQASEILDDLFEPLVTLDASDRPVPAAAESWQVSGDGLTYIFHLRHGLQWSDGSPLTAEDFVYTVRRVVDPATAAPFAYLCFPISNAQAIAEGRLKDAGQLGVEAPDAMTLRITLERPTPYWVASMANNIFLPVKRANVEKYGADFAQPGKLISNGAFILEDWIKLSRVTVRRNLKFHDAAAVHLDKVVFYPIDSEIEEFNRYRAGDLDVTNRVPSQQLDLIRQNMAPEMRAEPTLSLDYLGFNLATPPFRDNPKLRQALSMVIDRQALIDKIDKSGAPIAYSAVPAVGLPDYIDQPVDWAWLPMADKIARARQLYKEAGYDKDHPLSVELRTENGDNMRKTAVSIAAMWSDALGVKTSLIAESFKDLVDHRHAGKLQLFWYHWTGDYPDATTFLDLFTSVSSENVFGYRNPDYDRLVTLAEQSSDVYRRANLLQQAEDVLMSDNPVAPLYSRMQLYLVKPWVKGFHLNPCTYTYDRDVTIVPHEEIMSGRKP